MPFSRKMLLAILNDFVQCTMWYIVDGTVEKNLNMDRETMCRLCVVNVLSKHSNVGTFYFAVEIPVMICVEKNRKKTATSGFWTDWARTVGGARVWVSLRTVKKDSVQFHVWAAEPTKQRCNPNTEGCGFYWLLRCRPGLVGNSLTTITHGLRIWALVDQPAC